MAQPHRQTETLPSRKWANLHAALALSSCWYNFCRVHGTLRVTPAIEAGIEESAWTVSDLLR